MHAYKYKYMYVSKNAYKDNMLINESIFDS